MEITENTKTLSGLLENHATEEDYKNFIETLIEVIKDLYANFQFLRQDPAEEDYFSGYFLAMQVIRQEYPREYESLFRLSVDKGLKPLKLSQLFVEYLKEGKVIPLGDAVIDESQSGISSIMQGDTVRVNITFAPKSYMEKKQEILDKRKEDNDKEAKRLQEEAKDKDAALNAIRVATKVLEEATDRVVKENNLETLVEDTKKALGML